MRPTRPGLTVQVKIHSSSSSSSRVAARAAMLTSRLSGAPAGEARDAGTEPDSVSLRSYGPPDPPVLRSRTLQAPPSLPLPPRCVERSVRGGQVREPFKHPSARCPTSNFKKRKKKKQSNSDIVWPTSWPAIKFIGGLWCPNAGPGAL